MEKVRDNRRTGFGVGLAGRQVAVVGEDNTTLLTVNGESTLIDRVRHVIKSGIDS